MDRDPEILKLFKDFNPDVDMSRFKTELYAKMNLIDKMKASNERVFRFRRLASWCLFVSGMILSTVMLAVYYFAQYDFMSNFFGGILGGGPILDLVLFLNRYSDLIVPIAAALLFIMTLLPLLKCLLWTARYEYPHITVKKLF